MMKKRSRPIKSETMRQIDVGLNFLGGIGMYHKKTHIARNKNRFKSLTDIPDSMVKYLKR
jgi:hypothetical protein